MVEFNPILRKAYWLLAASGLIYVSIVCSLTFPEVQRFAVYLNKLNPTIWEDVNLVESFGFLKTQVQPFNLVTPDSETIYGWHLLPLHMCNEHAAELDMNKPAGPANDYTSTPAFKLLANDPNARVVVSFHGNAGHLGSAQRPETYRMLLGLSSSTNPIHVFSIDYRGFGLSTGTPTEEGLITDGVALLNFLTSSPLNISPSRITIVGQSLGTAVSAAVAERFLFGSSNPNAVQPTIKDPEPFAGVILMASFSNIPNLIESYSVKGITPPILSPLRGYSRIQNWARSHIVDRWDTAARVARLTGADGSMARSNSTYENKGLKLVILHAENDVEIPWYEGVRVFEAATNLSHPRKLPSIRSSIWEVNPDKSALVKEVLWKKVYYGGHNRIATFSEAAFEVLRTFHR